MTTTTMQPLLIELGAEELPVKALPGLAQAFFDGVLTALEKRGIAVERGDAKPLYTPRRLTVLLPGVAAEQPEQASEVLGPYLNIALDADGQPTRALQGFAAKAGVEWSALERTSDAKGERFVHRSVKPGASTAQLLPEILTEAIDAIPVPKPMRWGAHEYAFARPVLWLVVLHGSEVVDCEAFGVPAGRESRGHRFMHEGPVLVIQPDAYIDTLRAAKVLVDADERRARIVEQVNAAAQGGSARIDPDNLEQVNCLVEWPSAVACSFESGFLKVPAEALVVTMEANQKFFPVLDADGQLTERFIGIANIESTDVTQVRQGYERVIRPRFADAQFFFEEDLKQALGAINDGLESVTYQAKLGSLAAKVSRVAELARAIAPQAGADPDLAARAAGLSKADLQSRLVGEFPELQGIAGRYYALQDPALADLTDPDRTALADAIDAAYAPRHSGEAIAPSPLGRTLAIAERLDTLAGGFAAGLKPTGNKDPFALRRNALGLARTIIESGLALDLRALLASARALALDAMAATAEAALAAATGDKDIARASKHLDETLAARGTDPQDDVDALYDFILDRLKGYYADRGVPVQHFNAVAALRPASLHDFNRRIAAIGTFAALPEAEALAAADKRIRNILRKAGDDVPVSVDTALLQEPAERALAQAVDQTFTATDQPLASGDYGQVLARLAQLRPQVDAFFDAVMVNAEDPAVRGNRLALLRRLSSRLGSVAAIEHLSS
ncbi:glycine--tRNA ligase subunit beta [Luteimonas qiangzhengi]|uniref:glycine--tRNA ligase subunit beta n=1 Tax=Luteimonas sp. MJ146 TaxID=3129240 RepID=UPI0031BB2D65